MITNDVRTARRFVGAGPPDAFITKALGPTGITENGQSQVGFTRRLAADDLAESSGVGATATTLQEFVPKAFEVRLTVIGHELFGVAIHADSENAHTDWRSDPDSLRYELIAVPGDVAGAVVRYMERMNLAYAGIDFVVTPDNRWVMLEANTGPQVGWLEAATGSPITDALATMLAKGVR